MLSRSESQAQTRPVRDGILQLANYLQNVYGVRPENRDKTDPNQMPWASLRRWAVRYGVGLRDEDGELLTEETMRELCVERQLNPPGLEDDAASLAVLQDAYDELKRKRDAILEDTEEDVSAATGPAQTVVPKSLSVDMVQGMVGEGE